MTAPLLTPASVVLRTVRWVLDDEAAYPIDGDRTHPLPVLRAAFALLDEQGRPAALCVLNAEIARACYRERVAATEGGGA